MLEARSGRCGAVVSVHRTLAPSALIGFVAPAEPTLRFGLSRVPELGAASDDGSWFSTTAASRVMPARRAHPRRAPRGGEARAVCHAVRYNGTYLSSRSVRSTRIADRRERIVHWALGGWAVEEPVSPDAIGPIDADEEDSAEAEDAVLLAEARAEEDVQGVV